MHEKLKQFSIIFIIVTVIIFFVEYFFKLKNERIPHKIFHHTFAPNKTFIYHWGEYHYKICSDNNGF